MHFWSSTSMQMINHEVGILVSAINKPKNQWKIKGKVEKMRCSCRQDVSSRMQDQWNSIRRILCISQPIANFAMPKPISQCQIQFRNAKANFAMPIHCSFVSTYAKFRIAKFTTHFANFANPFRIAKFTFFAKFTFAGLVILCN